MKKRLTIEYVKRIGNKAHQFIEKRGFYISIILCVGIVSISTLFITSNEIGNLVDVEPNAFNEKEFADLSESIVSGNAIPSTQPKVGASATSSPKKLSNDASLSVGAMQTEDLLTNEIQTAKRKQSQGKYADATEQEKVNSKDDQVVFAIPVSGEVMTRFAKDKLVYSKTLNEWRSHLGIDIKADKGTPVKVIAKGIIKEVKNDPRYGATVVVEHQDGWTSMYSNLLKADTFLEGREVKQGDVIGGIGNTASFESLEPPHLHLELYKHGEVVDPSLHLPK